MGCFLIKSCVFFHLLPFPLLIKIRKKGDVLFPSSSLVKIFPLNMLIVSCVFSGGPFFIMSEDQGIIHRGSFVVLLLVAT